MAASIIMDDGETPPKLLEYNADTPTSLFEASIVQWNWEEHGLRRFDAVNYARSLNGIGPR